jgi:Rad3-related DNA helicase
MAVTNTAYLLQDLEAGGNLADDRGLVVIDEADELPSALVQHLALEVALADLELLRLPLPQDPLSARDWSLWARAALDILPERRDALSHDLDQDDDPDERARLALALRRLEMLSPRLQRLAEDDPDSWVVSCGDPRQGPFLLRPLWPARYAPFLLWSRLPGRVLFMSATLLDAAALARELGLRPGSWAALSLPSPIPPERRPVRYVPVASLSHENASASWPRALAALDETIALHPHERGVVHTQSYRLARYVLERSRHRHRLVGHSSAAERRQALEGHGARREAVLVSPSMQRGVDFAGDRARFAVVLKMPFPNLGDPWVAARLASPGGQEWYARETVRALVQACGRVCRGPDDYGITYILDSQFGRFLRRYRRLFPSWFLAALSDQDGAHNAFPGDDGLEQRLPRQEGDDPGDVLRPSASATATTALQGEG